MIIMSYQNNRNYPDNREPEYRGKRYRDDGYSSEYDNYDVAQSSYQRPQNRNRRSDGYGDNYDERYDRRRAQGEYYDDRYDDRYERRRAPREYYDERYDERYDRRRAPREYYDERYDDRYDNRSKKVKQKTSGGIIAVRVIAIILLIAGLGIAGYKLYEYYSDSKGHNELKALSHDFDQLYAKNNDFFGWLMIEDTVVDYPVMYSPDEPERYLHQDFDNDYSESGELFMDADCDPDGYHYLIYGHHMFNGSMFGSLPKYQDEDFFHEHQTFRFDTRFGMGEYEIFAVFYSKVYDEDDDVFKYYQYANLNDEGTYNYYVENVKAMSIYDTGITPEYGDRLVTLSTCNYHTDDGRFVVVARQK